MRIVPALLAPVALLGGCVMSTAATPQGPVALGQAQRAGDVTITPLDVVEDSRCPMNARCIWAGRVVVKVAIVRGAYRLERRLTLGEAARTDLGTVMLDSVTPERMTTDATPPDEAYRFHFSLIRR